MGEISDETKWKIKQAVGDLTGNKELEREGERNELKGKAEGVVNALRQAVKDAAE